MAEQREEPAISVTWACTPFSELTVDALYKIIVLRNAVFVVEQNCIYQDTDGKDPKCCHLTGLTDTGDLVAYARIVPPGISYAEPSIGRVITARTVRGTGVGKALMEQGIAHCQRLFPEMAIRISAQCYAEPFYAGLGFEPTGKTYLEDNIPHLEMILHPAGKHGVEG